MRNGEDYTDKNFTAYALHVLLLGLSNCGGKRFAKQLPGGPRIDGLKIQLIILLIWIVRKWIMKMKEGCNFVVYLCRTA